MKRIFTVSLALLSAGGLAFGQKPKSKEPRALIMEGEDAFSGYIVASSKKTLRYREKKNSTAYIDKKLSRVNVYFLQPEEFTDAMLLFQSRQYQEARAKFAECAAVYKKIDEIKGNYSTLAKFYEMECARKMNDLVGLGDMMEKFIAEPLVNKDHFLQLEINGVYWDAVQNKAWTRLLTVANDPKWFERKLPGSLRAQIAFCTGLCYEGTGEPVKALTAYNRAFTADFAASEIIAKKAALACFRILKNHDATKLAISLWGTEDYKETLEGAFFLEEGNALISLWEKSLGAGEKLPGEYSMFKKYAKSE